METATTNQTMFSDLFEFFSCNNYSDRMIEKMNVAINEFSASNGIKDLEVYEHFFFSNPKTIKISLQKWNKIVFSTNIIFNTIISKFLKAYTFDIYGSKIYQFNNNDARVFRNKIGSFFTKTNDYIVPFRYEKVNEFIHDLLKESFDNNYSKRNMVWKAFELSLLCSIFREVNEDSTIGDVSEAKVKEELKEVDILDTITDKERELVDSLFNSPLISKVFKRITSKKEYNEVVDEFIRISLIWARR